MAAMVHRLMAKDPADRYQTPAELAAALVPFCSSSSWSMSPTRAEVPYIDPLATPADSDSANPAAVHLVRDHDASALAATLHVDSFPIPLGTSELIGLSRVTDYRDHRQSRRWLVAILAAVASVAGLLAGSAALWWLTG